MSTSQTPPYSQSNPEEHRQHLEFIQGVVTRMNSNSFQIKGLSVTLIAALIAVYASNSDALLIYLGLPLTILFWALDTYYLQQERKFRALYKEVAGLTLSNTVKLYDMPTSGYKDGEFAFFNSFFSKTIIPIYIFIIALLAALLFIHPSIQNEKGVVNSESCSRTR